jgi:hypothetical protein
MNSSKLAGLFVIKLIYVDLTLDSDGGALAISSLDALASSSFLLIKLAIYDSRCILILTTSSWRLAMMLLQY